MAMMMEPSNEYLGDRSEVDELFVSNNGVVLSL